MAHAGVGMRDWFGEGLVALGRGMSNVVVVDCDVAHPTRAHHFKETFPERFIQLGVAEQNAMGVAAGLSTVGFIPFVNMFGCFASQRAAEQVSVSVAYPRLNVKICGCYAGLTTANTGASHQSIADVAVMRAMPNMVVIEPADRVELTQVLEVVARYRGPVYLRVVRGFVPDVTPRGYAFEIGRACVLRDGGDITLIGAGLMLSACLEAAEALEREGVAARVINMSSLKPIDEKAIVEAARDTGRIVTAENHSIMGGLGGAVAEVLARAHPVPMRMVGVRDQFGESGKLPDLLEKFGLTAAHIVRAARELLL